MSTWVLSGFRLGHLLDFLGFDVRNPARKAKGAAVQVLRQPGLWLPGTSGAAVPWVQLLLQEVASGKPVAPW